MFVWFNENVLRIMCSFSKLNTMKRYMYFHPNRNNLFCFPITNLKQGNENARNENGKTTNGPLFDFI